MEGLAGFNVTQRQGQVYVRAARLETASAPAGAGAVLAGLLYKRAQGHSAANFSKGECNEEGV
tara:strand:- start:1087 stop:1275 length:189 start_codon:yes stop_codon:yes gene_type:complete